MISFRNLICVGLVGSLLMACGSDDSGSTGGSSGTGNSAAGATGGTISPSDCSAVEAKYKAYVAAVGCTDDSSDIQSSCSALYALNKCTTEWAAFVNCFQKLSPSDFECDAANGNDLQPKGSACAQEQSDLEVCTDKLAGGT